MDHLDNKGRCCGRKPMVYKRPNHELFCPRCHRAFDPSTGYQVENWAWERHPSEAARQGIEGNYVKKPQI